MYLDKHLESLPGQLKPRIFGWDNCVYWAGRRLEIIYDGEDEKTALEYFTSTPGAVMIVDNYLWYTVGAPEKKRAGAKRSLPAELKYQPDIIVVQGCLLYLGGSVYECVACDLDEEEHFLRELQAAAESPEKHLILVDGANNCLCIYRR